MLYLIATPIGNLEDFSFRALSVLKNCDYALCEDTRHSRILLDHYDLSLPLKSFHKFNAKEQEPCVISDLKEGKTIALISDAGTPLISDPGYELIQCCIGENLPYTLIPGACALISALVLSGFCQTPFQFLGFPPKKEGELRSFLSNELDYKGTSLAYVSPHQIEEVLQHLASLDPNRPLCIARELTKKYEECLRGSANELLTHLQSHPPRGEFVLIIAPSLEEKKLPIPSQALVATLEKELQLSYKEALRTASQLTGHSKNEVYKHHLQQKRDL